LRGSKLSLYEGGIRMPFLVRWPGRVPAGRVDEQTVIAATDLFPTLCALAGATPPKVPELDGEDVSGALAGKPVARTRPLFWEYGRNTRSFAFPKDLRDRSPNLAVREGDWKLLVEADGANAQLYHLKADSMETQNVLERHSEIGARLKEWALRWRQALPGLTAD